MIEMMIYDQNKLLTATTLANSSGFEKQDDINNDLITQIRLGGRGRGERSKERLSKKERIRRKKEKGGKDKIRERRKGEVRR